MKNKLIITSLLTALSACSTTQDVTKSLIPTEIDGLKVFLYNETQKCGMKDKDDDFMQVCNKKTGEFLTGITYFRHDDKENATEDISYYKDGWKVKSIYKKNGIITSEDIYNIDQEHNLKHITGKSYFDNGNLRCDGVYTNELITYNAIKRNRTCYYINGAISEKYTVDRENGYISIDYAPNGDMLLKGVKPYTTETKSSKNMGIEENMVDKWTRYDVNGNLYNGNVTYYFDEEPTVVSSIISLKNGKRDGETHSFPLPKNLEKYDVKEWIYTYKDGTKVKSKTIFKDAKRASSETYYVGDNQINISHNKEENRASIDCRYMGHDTAVYINGTGAFGFVKLFEKNPTKSLCPDVSALVK